MKEKKHEIEYLWRLVDKLNHEFFYNRIVINEIEISSLEKMFKGMYYPKEKKIIIDKQHFKTSSKDELEHTVYHEMCHQLIIRHNIQFSMLLRNLSKKRNIDKIGLKAWRIKRYIETIVDVVCIISIVSGCLLIMYKLANGSFSIFYFILSVLLILGGIVLSIWFTDKLDEVLVQTRGRAKQSIQ